MEETRLAAALNWLSRFFIYAIIFLVPLFFLPWTAERLELNKYFLFYGLVTLSLLAYLGRAILRKEFIWRRTPLDFPLLILWLVFLLLSVLSIDRYVSFFGDFSLLEVSLVGLSFLIIFYFLVVQHLDSLAQVLKSLYLLLVGGALSVIYFLLATFKIFNLSLLPTSSPISSSNLLFGLFVVVILLLALSLLSIRTGSYALDGFALVIFLLSSATVVMLGYQVLWVVLAVGLFFLLVFFLSHINTARRVWLSVAFALLVLSLLSIFLDLPKVLSVNLPVEISLGRNTSWDIGVNSLTSSVKSFMFGSGPHTFGYVFSQFRPSSLNSTFVWNVRFNQPLSSALSWMATTGVLGSLAFLGVVLMLLGLVVGTWLSQFMAARKIKSTAAADDDRSAVPFFESPLLFWSIACGWVALTVGFFLFNFNATHWITWWLLTALIAAMSTHLGGNPLASKVVSLATLPQYRLIASFGFILVFTTVIVLSTYLGRFYYAEVLYAKALQQPSAVRIATMQRAIKFNSDRPLFHLALADAFLAEAVGAANKGNDTTQVYQLVALAVQASRQATSIAPKNVASWEFLSTIYANARGIAPDANQWLLSSLNTAISLEPTNPIFYLGLGNAKLLGSQLPEAAKDFARAIELKPDFVLAYSRLALVKEAQGDLNSAIETLEKGGPYGRGNPEYIFQLGRYYFNRNRNNDRALSELAFRQAIAINPSYSDAMFSLALLYESVGNKSSALPLYQRVLELNPGNKDLQRKIRELAPPPVAEPSAETKKK